MSIQVYNVRPCHYPPAGDAKNQFLLGLIGDLSIQDNTVEFTQLKDLLWPAYLGTISEDEFPLITGIIKVGWSWP
jgi:hypothetical protein